MAILVVVAVVVVVVFLLVRILNLTDRARSPDVFASKKPFINAVLKSCPILFERYHPPLVWGKSGHLQTIVGAKFGRTASPQLLGVQNSTRLNDGTVVTYDVFTPDNQHSASNNYQGKHMIVVVPGIANCSETKYVRTFVGYAIRHGFDVAVLNHLGAKKEVGLSTPRIFTYGGTEELAAVVKHLTSATNHKRLIGVGFSMGANILMKYVGEEPARQEMFECAISICQGYDILSAKNFLHDWDGFRRFYNWGITQNLKNVIDRHVKILFNGPNYTSPHKSSLHHVRSASSLVELDDTYLRKMAGFHHIDEFYEVNSSCKYMNQIKIPVLLLNALDDPLVPEELLATPHDHVTCNDRALFVVTHHGGHLGFFEGGPFSMSPITWLDKAIMQYIMAVIKVKESHQESPVSKQPDEYIIAS